MNGQIHGGTAMRRDSGHRRLTSLFISLATAAIAAVITLTLSTPALGADRLARIEQDLIDDSDIVHVPVPAVERKLRSGGDVLLFDVREPDEYAVGHLPGAIRVDPDISAHDFLEQFGATLNDKEVIFYCATGRRSTDLAEKVKAEIMATGASLPVPANMQGGIFRWHNESGQLVDAAGDTEYVHPYNWWWKRLLTHKDKTRYAPE